MKIAVLGAGISGLSLAEILKSKYNILVDIYEKGSRLGGLCRTEIINEYVYDISGGHMFNAKNKEAVKYIFSLLSKEYWNHSTIKSKIILGREWNDNHGGLFISDFYYPMNGGIQTLMNCIATDIDKEYIYGTVEEIEIQKNNIKINGKKYDLVINTMPLPEMIKTRNNIEKRVLDYIKELKYNSNLSLIYPIDKKSQYTCIYYNNEKIIPYRVVCQGNFSPYNAPEGRNSNIVEVIEPDRYKNQEILKNIKDNLSLENPISQNYTKYAYVILDKNRADNMKVIKNYMKNNHIILHGRFAEWEPLNMDTCILKSIQLAETINHYVRQFYTNTQIFRI